jgi:3D (Asp-Asp-Asp) domain-containing protein
MRKLITLLVIWQTLNVSAYCHTGNRTASGVWPQVGMAAADHLPFGAKVTLPDGWILTITDRFGGGYSDRLDIFLNSEAECWKFGRRCLKCRIETPN